MYAFLPVDELEPKSSSPARSAVICPRRVYSACSGFIVLDVDKEKVIGIVGC
jgi:hypothetical protein